MIPPWKCRFLLLIFGLSITASSKSGSPRIWLSDYSHKTGEIYQHIRPTEYIDFRFAAKAKTEFFEKTGPVNYTTSADDVDAVAFTCESDFPVVWVAPYPQFEKMAPQYSGARASIFNETLDLPLNKMFRSDFSFKVKKSGDHNSPLKATCVTTTSPERSATFYLHVKYEDDNRSVENGKEDDVEKNEGPLRPIDPPPGGNITARVSETVRLTAYTTGYIWEGYTHIFGGVKCCDENSTRSPVVDAYECGLVGGKRMLWAGLQRSKAKLKAAEASPDDKDYGEYCESKGFDVAPSVIVFCKGDGLDVLDEYVTVFAEDFYESLVIYNFIPVADLPDIEPHRKMVVRLARRPNLHQIRKPKRDANEFGRDINTDPIARSSLLTSILLKRDASRPWNQLEEIVPAAKGNEEELAEGEEVQVVCVYLIYFYTDGGKLRLNWRNGSKTIIPVDLNDNLELHMRPKEPFEFVPDFDHVHRRVVGKTLKVHADMESVDCFVPERRGVGWGVGSIGFNPIRAAIPPKFVGPKVTVLELEVNETGMGFSCEASLFPVLDISLIRDGDMRIDNWGAISVSTDMSRASSPHFILKKTVTFWLVSEDAYGDYQCVAENHAGRAVKRVQIIPVKSR